MPELPEVQTVVDDLNKKIKGDTIVGFESEWPKAIKGMSLAKFKKEMIGRKISGARRIGKNIFVDLSGGKTLYIHLKMTGHLLIKSKIQISNSKSNPNPKSKKVDYFDDRVNQYIRHTWTLKTKNHKLKTIDFSDMRKFAKIVLVDTDKVEELPEIKKLGIDAIDRKFTLKKFEELLEKRKNKRIGLVLMEQELIAGIGNIYRSEILFEAGIDPNRSVESLKKEEIKKVYAATEKILKKAIKMRGTSDSDYRDTSGAPGNFQKVLKVYGKTGKECPRCGTIVKRETMGQRSVFYCPICQK